MVLALVWRRRAPLIVFTVITGAALVQLTVGTLNGDLALLAAFYTLAAHAPARSILAAVALLEGAAVVVALSAGDTLLAWTLLSSLVMATWFTAYYARTRRSYLASLVSRASGWSVSGTPKPSSPCRPSAPGSRGKCTTSSRTTSP